MAHMRSLGPSSARRASHNLRGWMLGFGEGLPYVLIRIPASHTPCSFLQQTVTVSSKCWVLGEGTTQTTGIRLDSLVTW